MLIIVSSFIGTDFYHRQLVVFRNAKIKITIVTLITSYTNLATLKLVNILLFKLLSLLHVHSCHCVYRVHESLMSLNVLIISFEFADQPIPKTPVLFFTVGLPRTVCAFVSLTRDNIIEQYINTFLETPRPNVIETASYYCFEKFRIKRYPNRP